MGEFLLQKFLPKKKAKKVCQLNFRTVLIIPKTEKCLSVLPISIFKKSDLQNNVIKSKKIMAK